MPGWEGISWVAVWSRLQLGSSCWGSRGRGSSAITSLMVWPGVGSWSRGCCHSQEGLWSFRSPQGSICLQMRGLLCVSAFDSIFENMVDASVDRSLGKSLVKEFDEEVVLDRVCIV